MGTKHCRDFTPFKSHERYSLERDCPHFTANGTKAQLLMGLPNVTQRVRGGAWKGERWPCPQSRPEQALTGTDEEPRARLEVLGDSLVFAEAATRALGARCEEDSHHSVTVQLVNPLPEPKLAASPAGWAWTCVQQQVGLSGGEVASNTESCSRKESSHLKSIPQTLAEHHPGRGWSCAGDRVGGDMMWPSLEELGHGEADT